jgi:hypothetical protein
MDMEAKSMGRAKGRDVVTETIPCATSAQSTYASAQRRAANGGNDAGGNQGLLVGRWDMSMFEVIERDGKIEIWRRDEQPTSADVQDAAKRDPQAGLKAMNRLNKAWYGDK